MCFFLYSRIIPFQSTHPVWGATKVQTINFLHIKFQSTHPVWGATLIAITRIAKRLFQSTHPVWGATAQGLPAQGHKENFNPRTPCGVRLIQTTKTLDSEIFQSTHPVWGATPSSVMYLRTKSISIHAPRVGCDPGGVQARSIIMTISIHAPRVGCDGAPGFVLPPMIHFNPRTPCGVRLSSGWRSIWRAAFQSTHPVWGATVRLCFAIILTIISIHAPRVGCDA